MTADNRDAFVHDVLFHFDALAASVQALRAHDAANPGIPTPTPVATAPELRATPPVVYPDFDPELIRDPRVRALRDQSQHATKRELTLMVQAAIDHGGPFVPSELDGPWYRGHAHGRIRRLAMFGIVRETGNTRRAVHSKAGREAIEYRYVPRAEFDNPMTAPQPIAEVLDLDPTPFPITDNRKTTVEPRKNPQPVAGLGNRPKGTGSEQRRIFKQLRKAGLEIERGGKHYKVTNSDGDVLTTIAQSPSSRRWITNLRTELKKAGHDVL